MSKQVYVDPKATRAPRTITFADIDVNKYQKAVKDELGNIPNADLVQIYKDMLYVREFETMIQNIKQTGAYQGTEYNHPGPAHLGIGQEAAYVGQAYLLTTDDYSFGSHRSHGEIIARAMRAVETLPEDKLLEIMKGFDGGKIMKVIGDSSDDIRMVGRNFVLYGMTAETFGRENGFNRGLGGSMHAFFTPFGVYPNNAIVGGSGPIAPGAALYKLSNRKPGIVVCNIGDGSLACGPVWEGMVFSTMDQIRELWGDEFTGMPILFNIWNNSYAMGGQPVGETMGMHDHARIGAGLMPNELHAEKIDGYNPLAVIDAYRRKKDIVKEDGPVLFDIVTYRYSGHSPSDASTYRTKEEIEAWEKEDSIEAYGKQLIEAGLATEADLGDMKAAVTEDMHRNMKLAIDEKISPRIDVFGKTPNAIGDLMFSNQEVRSFDTTRKAEVNMPYEESPRALMFAKKERRGIDEKGNLVGKNKVYQIRDALAEPILKKFYEDPTLIAFGEDVRDWGGAYAVYRGFTETIPYHRFFNSPISEAAIVGAGVGYAMSGGRAVVEIMYADFLGRAGDELFNQLSKWQAMSAGVLKMPVVVRMSVGSKYGAQHSQDWSALCAHIPGLKVVFPATPYDAKGLMQSAINGTDPVIFFESQRIYDYGERFHLEGVPEAEYEIPIGEPDVKREGSDVTILSIGATLYRVVEAADILKEKYGISAEIIDARSLVPFNYEKVIESVKKTGRIIVTGDACERNSFMRNLASNITELAFDYLDAPPVVVGAKDWITPAHELEKCFFPQPSWIIDAIHERLLPIPGYVPSHNCTTLEQIRENAAGV